MYVRCVSIYVYLSHTHTHTQITKAVIAVPAKFDARQKRATGEAYKRAGLKVMRVLEEPTAAALAYGLHKKPNVHHILVYDFGGGTLDVSLLYVHNGFVTVEGIDGDDHLGGKKGSLVLLYVQHLSICLPRALTSTHTYIPIFHQGLILIIV